MTSNLLSIALLALLATSCATPGEAVAADLETPRYRTVVTDGAFTLRRYAPYVAAETTVDNPNMDEASRAGFRRLAGYIFGGNQGSRKISMTAPVTAEPAAGEGEKIAMTAPVGAQSTGTGWRITFMMPSRYTLETLPVPNDPRVTFVEVPGRCRAAVTFSWLTTDDRVRAHTDELRRWAQGRGLVEKGPPVVARYDDPFTLPWNRTNEIWLEVADGPLCGPAHDPGPR